MYIQSGLYYEIGRVGPITGNTDKQKSIAFKHHKLELSFKRQGKDNSDYMVK